MPHRLFAACAAVVLCLVFPPILPAQADAKFTRRIVASDLSDPWEVAWGPDGFLWVTERTGKRVTRINPATGEKSIALTLTEAHQDIAQDGLLGMAFDPGLLRGPDNNFVYLYFTYLFDAGPPVTRRGKLRRYTYDAKTATLGNPVDLVSGLPVGTDHISGRLAFGPDNKLYLSIGDEGANFLANACLPNRAQETPSAAEVQRKDWLRYQGKLLRINLDGSIPADNPIINGVRSHIYTYGHRNIQGIAFGLAGKLYTAEHGPSSDDEVNLIRPGGNYGWPNVAGYRDDKAYAYGNWSAAPSCSTLKFNADNIPPEVPTQKESDFHHPDFVEPIQTFFTVPDSSKFRTEGNATAALSGMVLYGDNAGIPGWANSLLVTGMRQGTVYRLKLSDDGNKVVGEPEPLFKSVNRPRDIAIAPGGKRIYVVTTVEGRVVTTPGKMTTVLENPGTLFEFTSQE